MRSASRLLFLLGFLVLPTFAHAQTTLAGVVRDASGGVLPGVTVEASSAAQIEKVRSAVTDGSGQYRITASLDNRVIQALNLAVGTVNIEQDFIVIWRMNERELRYAFGDKHFLK